MRRCGACSAMLRAGCLAQAWVHSLQQARCHSVLIRHAAAMLPDRYNKAAAGAVLGVPAEAGVAVRAAAKPFAEWLEEADSDDESDDE